MIEKLAKERGELSPGQNKVEGRRRGTYNVGRQTDRYKCICTVLESEETERKKPKERKKRT